MKRLFVSLALWACACASPGGAPISYGGASQPAEAPAQAQTPPTPDWAAAEGTPLSAYALQPNAIDPANLPRTHRVRAGETLYDIAALYQIPLRALIDQNRLEPPYALSPGRELRLPPPRLHTVARGERFADIAARYNVDTRSLALLNRMQPPYEVREGQRIVLPALARADAAEPLVSSRQETPALASRQDGGAPNTARFTWPLRGALVARFGPQPGGRRLDGVEIAGGEGARIVAAADGDVVYAGDDLPGYGTLVIVSHADGYVTAYGYNRAALVREGQRVRAGEAIAELGRRPDGRALLMFQVRQGGAPVDPAPLLGLGD